MAWRTVAYRLANSHHLESAEVFLEWDSTEGVRPVQSTTLGEALVLESGCLGTQLKEGGLLHLRLNMSTSPIANKYREGKLQSTLKRELTERETGGVETDRADVLTCIQQIGGWYQ